MVGWRPCWTSAVSLSEIRLLTKRQRGRCSTHRRVPSSVPKQASMSARGCRVGPWALAIAVMTFPYYWQTMPERCANRLAIARQVLMDAETR